MFIGFVLIASIFVVKLQDLELLLPQESSSLTHQRIASDIDLGVNRSHKLPISGGAAIITLRTSGHGSSTKYSASAVAPRHHVCTLTPGTEMNIVKSIFWNRIFTILEFSQDM